VNGFAAETFKEEKLDEQSLLELVCFLLLNAFSADYETL
jgi:hypothetical protein